MVSLSLVVGYHGCERSVAERVIAHDAGLQASRNRWEWLGSGISLNLQKLFYCAEQ